MIRIKSREVYTHREKMIELFGAGANLSSALQTSSKKSLRWRDQLTQKTSRTGKPQRRRELRQVEIEYSAECYSRLLVSHVLPSTSSNFAELIRLIRSLFYSLHWNAWLRALKQRQFLRQVYILPSIGEVVKFAIKFRRLAFSICLWQFWCG